MSRFAILIHDHPALHWDFLLENGESCRTWRLLDEPDNGANEIRAVEAADHRLMYLDYEGPVSGGRGHVTRWDAGLFEWLMNSEDECVVRLMGQRWRGHVRLVRETGPRWTCCRGG